MKFSLGKRMAGVTVSTLVIAGMLSGCAQGSASQAGTDSSGITTVKFMNFSSNGGHESDLSKIVSAFEKVNPKVKIKVETSAYADYPTKLQTAISGGTESDVFEIENSYLSSYAKSGVLEDLSSLDTSAYVSSLVSNYKYNGKQYALPESFSTVVLFYNKDLFDAAGVSYPTSSWTWEDEQAAAQKLTNKSGGVWGDYQPITYNELYKTIAQAGGSFLNKAGDATQVNTAAGKEGIKWVIEKSGTVMPTEADGANTADFDTNLFAKGKLAMWHTGSWNFSAITSKAPNLHWDISVEPGKNDHASAAFSNAVAVSSRSKVKDAAKKWVEYYTSSKTTVDTRLASSWELPPITDQDQLKPYLTAGTPENRQAVFDSLKKVVMAPVLEKSEQVQDAVNDQLTAMAAGRTSVDDGAKNIQEKVDPLLK